MLYLPPHDHQLCFRMRLSSILGCQRPGISRAAPASSSRRRSHPYVGSVLRARCALTRSKISGACSSASSRRRKATNMVSSGTLECRHITPVSYSASSMNGPQRLLLLKGVDPQQRCSGYGCRPERPIFGRCGVIKASNTEHGPTLPISARKILLGVRLRPLYSRHSRTSDASIVTLAPPSYCPRPHRVAQTFSTGKVGLHARPATR